MGDAFNDANERHPWERLRLIQLREHDDDIERQREQMLVATRTGFIFHHSKHSH